ncbi:NADPH-dependent FMN reductase [Stappia sp.]|uniref:NADPH-dependent FMN reductase n=1 Tax=Stappia sp. TaxID=1870903 RepID=UPI003A9A46F9
MTAILWIGLVQGSIRDGRFNDTITNWAARRLEGQGFALRRIDPRDPDLLPLQTGDAAAAARLGERLADLGGFVVVTPGYKHPAPGPLKTLIDAAHAEWQARPVGLISYGGVSGGLRASETLRPVFAELHAMTLRDTVSFAMPFGRFGEDGEMTDAAEATRADAAIATFGASLAWWGHALHAARERRPYEKRAA